MSHVFVMEWAAIIRDVVVGLLIAGCVGAWVPDSFWRGFFLSGHPLAAKLWGPLIGPVVAILSFVCSVGNVPLAAVLWRAGISFGGVTAFIFADLLILPILNIYRKYYGARMTLVILGTFYAAMVQPGTWSSSVFGGLGLVPSRSTARVAVTAGRVPGTTPPGSTLPSCCSRDLGGPLPAHWRAVDAADDGRAG